MIVDGKNLKTLAAFGGLTVPDCNVAIQNKIGHGHGEKKFYIGTKGEMHAFYGEEKFSAQCFMLKKDLIAYMDAIKQEYLMPSQNYTAREEMPTLWKTRMQKIQKLPETVYFTINDQYQIAGSRGYINSTDDGYKLIWEIALPLVSYIYTEKVGKDSSPLFYWKLYVDFEEIWNRKNGPLVFTYGKKHAENIDHKMIAEKIEKTAKSVRDGQDKYRKQLLEQCRCCPITNIADDRLLIASHIKPWAASNNKEKVDPFNGYMLSPMFDKLFDKGFITFREDKSVVLSEFISSYTWKQINIKNGQRFPLLLMDDKRIKYLQFHHESVFKGSYTD